MADQQLSDYIKKKIELGLSEENIRTILTTNGWKLPDVNQALDEVVRGIPAVAKKETEIPGITVDKKGHTGRIITITLIILILGALGWYVNIASVIQSLMIR